MRSVAPEHVLFPVGYRNRYGFPHPTVIARYRELGVHRIDTARSGAIRIVFDGSGREPVLESQRMRRYWHRSATVPPDP